MPYARTARCAPSRRTIKYGLSRGGRRPEDISLSLSILSSSHPPPPSLSPPSRFLLFLFVLPRRGGRWEGRVPVAGYAGEVRRARNYRAPKLVRARENGTDRKKKKKMCGAYFFGTYLPLVGKGKPSSAQDTCGVGFPAAEHFNDTAGPGWRVCSMKVYWSMGGASATC